MSTEISKIEISVFDARWLLIDDQLGLGYRVWGIGYSYFIPCLQYPNTEQRWANTDHRLSKDFLNTILPFELKNL